jgi:hypothetical protein
MYLATDSPRCIEVLSSCAPTNRVYAHRVVVGFVEYTLIIEAIHARCHNYRRTLSHPYRRPDHTTWRWCVTWSIPLPGRQPEPSQPSIEASWGLSTTRCCVSIGSRGLNRRILLRRCVRCHVDGRFIVTLLMRGILQVVPIHNRYHRLRGRRRWEEIHQLF